MNTVSIALPDAPRETRLALLMDEMAPALNIRFDALSHDFDLAAQLFSLPGVSIMFGVNSPARVGRGDLSRQSDDLELVWNRSSGRGFVSHLGRETDRLDGSAVLASSCDHYESTMFDGMLPTILRMERKLATAVLPHAEEMFMRPIAPDNPAFALLRCYLTAIRDASEVPPALATVAAAHICDLVALAVGTTRDAAAFCAGRGLETARLVAAKQAIETNLQRPGLSVEDIAAAVGVSKRSLQYLFERDGTTFTQFVLRRRLEHARRRLQSPLYRSLSISQIAFDAGFGDLSHFNHSFRSAYEETPSDCRQRL